APQYRTRVVPRAWLCTRHHWESCIRDPANACNGFHPYLGIWPQWCGGCGKAVDQTGYLLDDGTWTYGYDQSGDLVSKTLDSGGVVEYFDYDADHELISVTEINSLVTITVEGQQIPPGQPVTIHYDYDAFGQRV